jgi:hypothetical protein
VPHYFALFHKDYLFSYIGCKITQPIQMFTHIPSHAYLSKPYPNLPMREGGVEDGANAELDQ